MPRTKRVAGFLGMAILSLLCQGLASASERLLIEAARQGSAEVTRDLLKRGADPNVGSPSGWTALMEAAAGGRQEVAEVLIAAHADLDTRDRLGRTALDVAERAGHTRIVRLLRSKGARGSGKSVGDTVCVKKWRGSGFCGAIESVDGNRLLVRVTLVQGCADVGCEADTECSQGEPIGNFSLERRLWVRNSCLTQTYPGSGR